MEAGCDPNWADCSVSQLEAACLNGPLLINDTIYAELSVRYERIETLGSTRGASDHPRVSNAARNIQGRRCLRWQWSAP